MATPVDDRREGTIPQTIHQKRFVAAFSVLAILLTASVAVTVWLAERGKASPWTAHTSVEVNDSGRQVTRTIADISDPVERAQAVATLVQGRYLGADGKPLGTVSAGEDISADAPGANQVVAMHATATGPPLSFEYGNIVFFKICGRGADCAFDTSKAAQPQRVVALTSRQAKELAIRGLKYVTEADAAIIVMPGGILQADGAGGAAPTVVYYYRRSQLQADGELKGRLNPNYEGPEPTPAQITDADAATMFGKYGPHLFRLNGPKPSPDGVNLVYELVPPPPAG